MNQTPDLNENLGRGYRVRAAAVGIVLRLNLQVTEQPVRAAIKKDPVVENAVLLRHILQFRPTGLCLRSYSFWKPGLSPQECFGESS